jgi:mRNA interferase MazF
MNRGDIYWVNLDPTSGSEIQKKGSCVLVGANPINQARRTVVVIPLSSSGLMRPPLTIGVRCLDKEVVAVCDQIRAVDKSRRVEPAGTLSAEDIKKIEEGLRLVLCL